MSLTTPLVPGASSTRPAAAATPPRETLAYRPATVGEHRLAPGALERRMPILGDIESLLSGVDSGLIAPTLP